MTYRVLEWNYEEVNSIIAKLSNACLELTNTPALSTSDTGSEHDATLGKHVTALNSTRRHMAWILNGIYLGLAAATEWPGLVLWTGCFEGCWLLLVVLCPLARVLVG